MYLQTETKQGKKVPNRGLALKWQGKGMAKVSAIVALKFLTKKKKEEKKKAKIHTPRVTHLGAL